MSLFLYKCFFVEDVNSSGNGGTTATNANYENWATMNSNISTVGCTLKWDFWTSNIWFCQQIHKFRRNSPLAYILEDILLCWSKITNIVEYNMILHWIIWYYVKEYDILLYHEIWYCILCYDISYNNTFISYDIVSYIFFPLDWNATLSLI